MIRPTPEAFNFLEVRDLVVVALYKSASADELVVLLRNKSSAYTTLLSLGAVLPLGWEPLDPLFPGDFDGMLEGVLDAPALEVL
jgi:hypothetical protein